MSDARANILARLRAAPPKPAPSLPDWQPAAFAPAERVARFCQLMEAFHAEVHEVGADWPERLRTVLANRGVASMLFSPATDAGRKLAQEWGEDAPKLVAYDRAVEELKPTLVHGVDAGFTTTLGGIADTGTLVLWPTPDEPA